MSLRERLRGLRDRFTLVEWGIALFALAILVKAADVQLLNGRKWTEIAARQQTRLERLPAPRGRMIDATGMPLVESRELVSFSIAPREIRRVDRATLARTLKQLKAPPVYARRALDTTRLPSSSRTRCCFVRISRLRRVKLRSTSPRRTQPRLLFGRVGRSTFTHPLTLRRTRNVSGIRWPSTERARTRLGPLSPPGRA